LWKLDKVVFPLGIFDEEPYVSGLRNCKDVKMNCVLICNYSKLIDRIDLQINEVFSVVEQE